MLSSARRTVLIVLTGVLTVILALPASAGQLIGYNGQTSQDQDVRLQILKRDNGRRFIRDFTIMFTTTCEDSTTQDFGLGMRPGRRLSETGGFQKDYSRTGEIFDYSFHLAGSVGFKSANGTFEFNYATLTGDDQAQLCTTGTVDWSADRGRAQPARTAAPSMPDGVTFLKIDRHGQLVEVAGPKSGEREWRLISPSPLDGPARPVGA